MRHITHSNGSITLENLLRRRRSNLKSFLTETGINTYEFLVQRCERMGVVPPSKQTFDQTAPAEPKSSPTEGIIVLESPPLISESTGENIKFPDPVEVQPSYKHKNKKRRDR